MAATFEETDARIAEQLIASMDDALARGVKWVAGWDRTSGFPVNPTTGRTYGGSYNGVILLMAAAQFGDSRFAGYGQWKKAGNKVNAGEKGIAIFFPKFKCSACSKPAGYSKVCGGKGGCGADLAKRGAKRMAGFGHSTVFNNQQGENPMPSVERADVDPAVGYEAAAAIVAKAGADVRHEGARCYYSPTGDFVGMAPAATFTTMEDYWSTLLHEHAHWTGAASRLNRPGITNFSGFGSEAYAYEELVAEISASFLCKHAGVSRDGLDDQHAAYLASWRKALSDDPAIIRRAVGEAGKVLRYLTK
tara:strand:+ start:973 stop:1887 length:915 start_codon:yes stop_codon:yes gene_type:complete